MVSGGWAAAGGERLHDSFTDGCRRGFVMKRTALLLLSALVAIVVGFHQADQPVVIASAGPEVSVRLTQAETDCIVGGQDGCISVGVGAFDECIGSLNAAGELDGVGDLIECGTVGLYSGVACAISWFLGLLF